MLIKNLLPSFTPPREDLIQALLTSCHIPWYFDGSIVRNFRQTPCFDGGEGGQGRGGRGLQEDVGMLMSRVAGDCCSVRNNLLVCVQNFRQTPCFDGGEGGGGGGREGVGVSERANRRLASHEWGRVC